MKKIMKKKIGLGIQLLLTLFIIGVYAPCFAAVYTLQWDENKEPDLVGYRVYYRTGPTGGPPYDNQALPFQYLIGEDDDPSPKTFEKTVDFVDDPVFIAVTAYDNEGLESNYTEITTLSITGVTPNKGHPVGGKTVTITGIGFNSSATVTFDGFPATNVNFVSDQELTCVIPAHPIEAEVDVVVTITTPITLTATLTDGFEYVAFSIQVDSPGAPFYDSATGIHLVTSGSTPYQATFSGIGSTPGDYNWALSGVGSIDSTTADSITYTAPASITGNSQTDTLTLTSDDGTLSDEIDITVYNPMTITWPIQAAGIAIGDITKVVTATSGTGTYAFQSTSTGVATVSGTSGATAAITPVAVGTFNVQVRDNTYGAFGAGNGFDATTANIEIVTAITIGNTPANDEMESDSTNIFTATGGKNNGQVDWEASAGTIDATGNFTAPFVATGSQQVTITAYDKTYNKNHYTPIKREYTVTVFGALDITSRPESYVDSTPSTYPLVAGTGLTYDVTAAGGPAGNFDWSIIEDRTGLTRVGPVSSGATYGVDIDNLFNNWGAGVYTVRAVKGAFTPTEMKIRIPMRIVPMTGIYKDNDPDQNFIVTGHPDPYTLNWSVTNEAGTAIADQTFVIFQSTTSTNPGVNAFDFQDINRLTTFRTQAQSADAALVAAGLDKVITNAQVIKPVLDFNVQVNDSATSIGITGADVTAVHDQTLTDATDGTGLATISDMENSGVTYTFSVEATNYAPTTFTTSDLSQTSTVTLVPVAPANQGTIEGTVSLSGNPGGTGILVTFYGNSPQVLANSTTGAYTLTFDTSVQGNGPYTIIAEKAGYVTDIDDNAGVVNATLGQTNADINLPQATKITITDDGGSPSLTYSITATPAFNNTVGEIQIFAGTEATGNDVAAGANFAGGTYTYAVTAPDTGKSSSIYVQADTSTAGRVASSGYFATATHTVVAGITPTAPLKTDITDPNAGGTVTSTNGGKAYLPPGGVDSLESVTLSMSDAPAVSTTTGSALIFMVTLTYTDTGEPVPNTLINKIYVTIQFDPTKVSAGDLLSGAMAIYQASDWSAMAAGNVTVVPHSQIMAVNDVTGEVTFWVDYPAVFGIGSVPGGDDPGESGGCFIATAAYGSPLDKHVRVFRQFRDVILLPTLLMILMLGVGGGMISRKRLQAKGERPKPLARSFQSLKLTEIAEK